MRKNFLFGLLAILLAGFGFGGVSLADSVVKIGNGECGTDGTTCYESLAGAIQAAQTNDTIVLLANINLDAHVELHGVNIDLNGYTVSGTNNNGIFDCYGNVTISDSSVGNTGKIKGKWGVWGNPDSNITINNVKIETTIQGVRHDSANKIILDGVTIDSAQYGMLNTDTGILEIKNGTNIKGGNYGLSMAGDIQITVTDSTIEATNEVDDSCWGIALFDTATLEINGTTNITSKGYGISTNGNAGQNATIVINGGNINGAELGIYQPSGTVTINGGQIQGETAIYQKAGNLTISGATLIANGAANAYNYWGNGGNPTGDGIVVDSCAYPGSTIGDNPNLTILDGVSITSQNGQQVGYYEANTDQPGWSMGVISSNDNNLTLPGSFVWIADGNVFKIGYTVEFNCGVGCSIVNGNVLLGNTITKPDAPDGYTIDNDKWYKDSEKSAEWDFDDVVHVSDADHVNGTVTLYATGTAITYTITYNLNEGTNGANPTSYTVGSDTIIFAAPTRDGYDFGGWFADSGFAKELTGIVQGSTGNVTLYARWNEIKTVAQGDGNTATVGGNPATEVVFDENVPASDNEEEKDKDSKDNDVAGNQVANPGFTAEVKGGVEVYVKGSEDQKIIFTKPFRVRISLPGLDGQKVRIKVHHSDDPVGSFSYAGLVESADGACDNGLALSGAYAGDEITVAGGYVDIWTCSASTFVAYTETANQSSSSNSSSSGGGGGGSSKKDATKTETGVVADTEEADSTTDTGTTDTVVTEDLQKVLDDGFTVEFHNAYDFAFQNGITTMSTIQEADMEGSLTRIAMAKMLSQYAINILGKTPDKEKTITFPDVDNQLNSEYNNGVTLAYQLGIMGIGIDEFRPYDKVTRAEFATALSRMLFGLADGGELYYSTHLAKLMEEKIITNDNPNLQELRGYVMIMLMRSASK